MPFKTDSGYPFNSHPVRFDVTEQAKMVKANFLSKPTASTKLLKVASLLKSLD